MLNCRLSIVYISKWGPCLCIYWQFFKKNSFDDFLFRFTDFFCIYCTLNSLQKALILWTWANKSWTLKKQIWLLNADTHRHRKRFLVFSPICPWMFCNIVKNSNDFSGQSCYLVSNLKTTNKYMLAHSLMLDVLFKNREIKR